MTHPLFDLTGKIAVVTGATHGLGMSMACGLASAGATLIINGNSSQEKIDNAVAAYRAKGFKAFGYKFNVTDEAQVIAAVDQIEILESRQNRDRETRENTKVCISRVSRFFISEFYCLLLI